ncbi:hypothetical protein [Leptolyngbya subtilissima]|uniref:hypothetical protein n=1 Tax=Leptolyngbya subtilissima TaxID=1346803 RepID=UPI0016860427
MGVPLDVFRLYQILGNPTPHYVLAKAVRPDFPNWNQIAEDAAIDEVERRLNTVVEQKVGPLAARNAEIIATWEGGLPAGDCFYETASDINVPIWFALDAVHPGYFVFGMHPNEATFWQSIEELSRDGEICPITDYIRPAKNVEVRFVQL